MYVEDLPSYNKFNVSQQNFLQFQKEQGITLEEQFVNLEYNFDKLMEMYGKDDIPPIVRQKVPKNLTVEELESIDVENNWKESEALQKFQAFLENNNDKEDDLFLRLLQYDTDKDDSFKKNYIKSTIKKYKKKFLEPLFFVNRFLLEPDETQYHEICALYTEQIQNMSETFFQTHYVKDLSKKLLLEPITWEKFCGKNSLIRELKRKVEGFRRQFQQHYEQCKIENRKSLFYEGCLKNKDDMREGLECLFLFSILSARQCLSDICNNNIRQYYIILADIIGEFIVFDVENYTLTKNIFDSQGNNFLFIRSLKEHGLPIDAMRDGAMALSEEIFIHAFGEGNFSETILVMDSDIITSDQEISLEMLKLPEDITRYSYVYVTRDDYIVFQENITMCIANNKSCAKMQSLVRDHSLKDNIYLLLRKMSSLTQYNADTKYYSASNPRDDFFSKLNDFLKDNFREKLDHYIALHSQYKGDYFKLALYVIHYFTKYFTKEEIVRIKNEFLKYGLLINVGDFVMSHEVKAHASSHIYTGDGNNKEGDFLEDELENSMEYEDEALYQRWGARLKYLKVRDKQIEISAIQKGDVVGINKDGTVVTRESAVMTKESTLVTDASKKDTVKIEGTVIKDMSSTVKDKDADMDSTTMKDNVHEEWVPVNTEILPKIAEDSLVINTVVTDTENSKTMSSSIMFTDNNATNQDKGDNVKK